MSLPSKPASLANCTDIGSAYDAAVFILEQWPDDEGSENCNVGKSKLRRRS
jgi:hypothetical protein